MPLPKSATDALLTDEEISTEIGNLVFAGTDTTSTTLTYLFWRLGHSEWQERLRVDLASVELVDGVAAFQHLTEYRILDAVISETLRLHPPAPASLQRETPVGGRELGGYFVPAGVRSFPFVAFAHRCLTPRRLSCRCNATLLNATQMSFSTPMYSIQHDGLQRPSGSKR